MFEQELDKEVKVGLKETQGLKRVCKSRFPPQFFIHPAVRQQKSTILQPSDPMLNTRNYVFVSFFKPIYNKTNYLASLS